MSKDNDSWDDINPYNFKRQFGSRHDSDSDFFREEVGYNDRLAPIECSNTDEKNKTHIKKQRKNVFANIFNSFKRSDDIDPETGDTKLKSDLNGFSLQMIAIGGSIGTGLLIGSGRSLAEGGAVPLLLGYIFVATFIYCMCQSLGELSVAMPITGSFTRYASMLIDESWGFAMGWNYCLQWLILLPMELVASTMTISYWSTISTRIPNYAIIIIFYFLIILMNILSVKYYGLFEIIFSSTKVIAIIAFLMIAVLEVCGWNGKERIGFKYWKDPGAFSERGLDGLSSLIVTAAFSFSGSELVGLTASESRNPDKEVPKALKQVFWRICTFYLSSLFLVGLLVPYDHPKLVGDFKSDVNASPFVLALSNAKDSIFSDFMNGVILVSILSVGNSSIYASSRTLVALAENGHAPKFLKFIDRQRRPTAAVLTSISFGALAFVSCISSRGAETMFLWLVAVSGISVVFTYGTISLCHIRFRRVLKYNGVSPKAELPFRSQCGLFGSYYSLCVSIFIITLQIYLSIKQPGTSFSYLIFLERILGIVVVIIFYTISKIYVAWRYRRFHFMKDLENVDIMFGRFANARIRAENREKIRLEREEMQTKKWFYKVYHFWC